MKKFKFWRRLLLVLPIAVALGDTPSLQPIAQLDLTRYQGTWFEIAKYPNRFQAMCVRDTTAQYRIQSAGRVEVQNRCTRQDGSIAQVTGAARLHGATGSAMLEVRFAPAWLAWLHAVWAPYWVFDLDSAYSLAAVGHPTRDYLWILSRTPTVDPERYHALLRRIQAAGYDVSRLETTPQRP
jgi:apolipoprotein D and lipocalin family protein